jgi:hypothetical protein
MSPLPQSAAKYLKTAETPQASEAFTTIDKANQAIPVLRMLWAMGCDIPSEVEKSWKFFCPMGAEHSDNGKAKAARYYPETNSAFCFDGHDALTPVKLTAWANDVSYDQAAKQILDEQGISYKKQSYQERWEERKQEQEQGTPSLFDTSFAVQSLRDWLNEIPEYTSRQYDVDIRETLVYCLDVLNEMKTLNPDTVRQWLKISKNVMSKKLGLEKA